MSVLRRDYLPEELLPLLQSQELDGTVAVQADQSEAENQFLLELAAQYDFIKGVVGWIDLRSPDLTSLISKYAAQPKMKGFRHVVQGEPAGFMLNPAFIDGVKMLGQSGYTYDILIFHYQLAEALQFVEQLPKMRLVIDHCAKPDIKSASFDQWCQDLKEISKYEHVYLKLSGLVTEADWVSWNEAEIIPYIKEAISYFGVDRVMIGSDWPVCTLAGSYDRVINLVRAATQDLSETDLNMIFGLNAIQFYQL